MLPASLVFSLDVNTEFLKLHIICNRKRLVLTCKNSVYFSTPHFRQVPPSTLFALATALRAEHFSQESATFSSPWATSRLSQVPLGHHHYSGLKNKVSAWKLAILPPIQWRWPKEKNLYQKMRYISAGLLVNFNHKKGRLPNEPKKVHRPDEITLQAVGCRPLV